MTLGDVVTLVVAGASGLGLGGGVAATLIRRELRRAFEILDRIPPKEWFDRVGATLEALPRADELNRQLEAGRTQGTTLKEHAKDIEALKVDVADHEQRLRLVEGRRANG